MKKSALLIIIVMVITACLSGCTKPTTMELNPDVQAFQDCVSAKYSKALMEDLIAFGTNEDLGFRTAGSSAEIKAANYIEDEMTAIGLQNVHKEEITVDTFTFENADLKFVNRYGLDTKIEMAMFQTTYVANDEEVEILYLGQGTEDDYKGVDVSGKIVLIDIDQYENWWINWPAYQAKVKGAKAVIAVNTSGYCTYSKDTIGVQDYCGPSDAPAFSISVADAKPLKEAIRDNGGSISAILNASGVVEHDGTSYNVYGEIPGKTDEVIYMFAHYDAYFRAFSDNTSGVGGLMGIAKALVESGYEPNRTIRFIAHGAEEWGLDNSRYDWARGAEVEMEMHPDWIDNAFMAINLDGGLIDSSAKGVELTVPYELSKWVLKLSARAGESPFEGAVVSNSPSWTWTEAFSYTTAGIPVVDSGLYGSDNTGSYHSSSDTKEANNFRLKTFAYTQKFYGSLAIWMDKQPIRVFNYQDMLAAMKTSVDNDIIANADELKEAMDKASIASIDFYDASMAKKEVDEEFNRECNYLFKQVTNELFGLDWNEEFDFLHCYKQTNVGALKEAIAALEDGDVATALDEHLWKVDLNWYAYEFDKETYDYFVNQVLGEDARNSWGEGYLTSNADLWQVIQDLQKVYDKKNPDVSKQIEALKAELEVQEADLAEVVAAEIEALNRLASAMKELSK